MSAGHRIVSSIGHAWDGVVQTFRDEPNFRIEGLIGVVAVLLGIALRVPYDRILIIVLLFALVLVAELFNTAIERTVDLVTGESHPLAKYAKDASAGAVLVLSACAVIVGMMIYTNALVRMLAVS